MIQLRRRLLLRRPPTRFSAKAGRSGIAPRVLAVLAWACFQPGSAWAAETSPLFAEDGLLEVGLTGPVSTTIADRELRKERPFVLGLDGTETEVWVRVRGKSRSRDNVCKFPPLRLRFDQATGVFAGLEKVKLVTHCRNDNRGDANVMEEYAAYRVFNLLSPLSFRVRPLRITYTDTEGRLDKKAHRRYGFLIEPVDHLAVRTGGIPLEREGVSLAELDMDQAALVYVFQYLIGNTDWSLVTGDGADHCCHNGQLLEVESRTHYVPYDFDLSGLVNASYAKPQPELRLRSVRKRRYRGFCTEPDTLFSAIRAFVALEEGIFGVFRSTPGLSENDREAGTEYLEQFFKKARDEDKLRTQFERQCLSP